MNCLLHVSIFQFFFILRRYLNSSCLEVVNNRHDPWDPTMNKLSENQGVGLSCNLTEAIVVSSIVSCWSMLIWEDFTQDS